MRSKGRDYGLWKDICTHRTHPPWLSPHGWVKTDTNIQVTAALQEHTDRLNLETLRRDFDRAVSQADQDPEDAITAACSTLESVCKCLLDELGQPYPNKMDVAGLMREIQKHLNLSPGRTDLPAEIEHDVKMVLQGISTVAQGIGALRTHAGDAHGRGKRQTSRVDSRIARLAIHAASTISVFLIETWQVKCQAKPQPGE